jgi:hypothetical protein
LLNPLGDFSSKTDKGQETPELPTPRFAAKKTAATRARAAAGYHVGPRG